MLAFLGNCMRKTSWISVINQLSYLFSFWVHFIKQQDLLGWILASQNYLFLMAMCPFFHFSYSTPSLLNFFLLVFCNHPPTCFLTPNYFGYDFYKVYKYCGKLFFKIWIEFPCLNAIKTPVSSIHMCVSVICTLTLYKINSGVSERWLCYFLVITMIQCFVMPPQYHLFPCKIQLLHFLKKWVSKFKNWETQRKEKLFMVYLE